MNRVFVQLLSRYRYTPFVLLSPLAEGADRLVAHVAGRAGLALIVPLPLPRGLYEADFKDASSLQEFNQLLDGAQASFTLELLPGVSTDQVEAQGPARDEQYALTGAFIARHSAILLALWDGENSTSVGGTAQIRQFQLYGVPQRYAPSVGSLDFVESGVVYQVVTPRVTNPRPTQPAFRVQRLPSEGAVSDRSSTPSNGAGDAFDRLMQCVDTFNRDALRHHERLQARRDQTRHDVLPDDEWSAVPDALKLLIHRFTLVDAMAVYYRNGARRTLRSLFALTFMAIVLFALFAHLLHDVWQLLGANLITIALAYTLYLIAGTIPEPIGVLGWLVGADRARRLWFRREDFKTKYLDYRALAEGMRVQLFWRLAGLPHSVADNYLRKQRSELDWIRNAVRTWTLLASVSGSSVAVAAPQISSFQLILDHWIDKQGKYFRDTAADNRRAMRRARLAVQALLLLSIGLTFILLGLAATTDAESTLQVRERLIVAIVCLSAMAALIEGYAEKTAITEQAKQYQQMHELFARAAQLLRPAIAARDTAAASRIVEELGKEALAENGDWVLMHRARPVEVPMEG